MRRVGLFIGINQYKNGIPKLNCAARDAESVCKIFFDNKFDHVELLRDNSANSVSILNRVEAITKDLLPGDLFVLYFSGHGEAFRRETYLCASDACLNSNSSQGLVSLWDLECCSLKSGLNRLFIFDCCRFVNISSHHEPDYDRRFDHVRDQTDESRTCILYSCSLGECSGEPQCGNGKNGFFTQALIDVLTDKKSCVKDFLSMIRRVNADMERSRIPQKLFLEANISHWSGVSLFQNWDEISGDSRGLIIHGEILYEKAEYKLAVKCFTMAAKQCHPEAQKRLGDCYYKGDGVQQNYEEAKKWYKQAAEQGFAEAQYRLGVCYYKGYGVRQNYKKAVEWYEKAAIQGFAEAQYCLGECYFYGEGVRKGLKTALKWYQKAADQELAEAQCRLGECYFNGEGVRKDLKRALKWYQKAADQELAKAQNELGQCYENGWGVPKDLKKAIELYRIAAKAGDEDAKANLQRLNR